MFDCRGQAWRPTGGDARHVYDVVGIGFGPSGLALGIAIEEHNAAADPGDRILAEFLERQPRFGWHRGMLLPGTTMQVSFLKDLATMRNPHSTFSFVSHLHAQGRLVDFINGKSLFPRGSSSTATSSGSPSASSTSSPTTRDRRRAPRARRRHRRLLRRRRRRRQRHPRPQHRRRDRPDADPARRHRPLRRVWHTSELLPRLAALGAAEPRRFVVVGAGQSAAEATEHLHDRFAAAEICSVFSRYGYSPADDSPFANQIFDPAAVDTYDATADAKRTGSSSSARHELFG